MQTFCNIGKSDNSTGRSIHTSGKYFAFLWLLMAIITQLQAQTSQTLYFMDGLPQSALVNPANGHRHNYHIGLPVLSSFNVNARTNFVRFSDMFFRHSQYDSLISFLHPDADITRFTSRLKDMNTLSPDMHINVLSLGFRVDRSFFSFNISERASMRADLPRDLFMLGLHGNEQFVGREADFSGLGADLNYFREYAAGWAYEPDSRLSLGGRVKLLFGKANLSLKDSESGLFTDPDNYNMRLNSRFNMNFSLPVTLIKDDDGRITDILSHFDTQDYTPGDFIFNSGNAGLALDLGAIYNLSDQVTLSASITDLGFIKWKQDVYNFKVDGVYEFEGIDISPFFDYSDDSDPAENLLDTLRTIFSLNDTRNSYTRGLPARIYLGGSYRLNSMVRLGLLSRSEIYQGNLRQAVTLSANSDVGRWLSASLSYSVMNNSYNNLGMGLSLQGGGFQLYMLSDNLSTIFMPHRTKSINLWFGLNLVFGQKPERVAEPYIHETARPVTEVPVEDKPVLELPAEEPAVAEPVAEPEVAEPVVEPEKEIEPEIAEPVARPEITREPVPYFYVIAASMPDMRRAAEQAEILRQKGYETGVVYSEPDRYRVYIHVSESRGEAVRMLEGVRSRGEIPDAWLLRQVEVRTEDEPEPAAPVVVPEAVPEPEPAAPQVVPEAAPEPEPEPVSPVVAPEAVTEPVPRFYIVAASLLNMRSATEQAEILRQKGYEADIIYTPPDRYRVYIYAFENRSDALRMLESVRSRGEIPDAWLLRQ